MQSINNLNDKQKKILIISLSVFIILPLFYITYQASTGNNPNKKGVYYDKNSGQTVTNNGAQPETFGVGSETPTYLGTAELFKIGVTKYQLAALEKALFDFAKTVSNKPSELSIDVKTITPVAYDPEAENPVNETSYLLQVDRKTKYKIKMQYSGLGTVKIYASNLKGEQLFVSEEIDGTTISE